MTSGMSVNYQLTLQQSWRQYFSSIKYNQVRITHFKWHHSDFRIVMWLYFVVWYQAG